MRGSVHVTFEEGTQAQWLHDLLIPRVHRVLVCDRRGEKRQGNKGDIADADQLSEDLRRGSLRAVYHGSGHRAALKELARTYENTVEDTTRTMLRLKALFRARAIRTPGPAVYQPDTRGEWLGKLPEPGRALPGGVPFRAARHSERDPAAGQGRAACRGTERSCMGAAPRHPVSRTRTCRVAPCGDANALEIPHEAEPVGILRARGGHSPARTTPSRRATWFVGGERR